MMSYLRLADASSAKKGRGGADLVAIPEQRARIFRATRSPNKILRTGPRTVAHCLMGVMLSPSETCHSTLYICQHCLSA